MKISNSKKKLARIISDNGGWRKVAEFAAQCIKGEIGFWHDKPTKSRGEEWCGSYLGTINDIKFSGERVGSWAQTTLSRDEYFHLYPAPDADGWIEWKGGERPVDGQTMIDVKFRYGACATSGADCFNFTHDDHKASDIIAYRLHKPEQQKSTAVGDDETNLAAKKELEALEFSESPEQRAKLAKIYTPSIEQLAADYRAKLAIAQQAQEVADSHRCDAESALDKLVAKGKELGLVIGIPTTEHHEPEIEITNRSQLELGDVIWISRSGNPPDNDKLPEGEYQVVKVGTIGILNNGKTHYPDFTFRSWRFIRRP